MTHTIRLLAIIVLLALNMPVQADSRNFDQAKALAVKKAKSLGKNISDLQVNRAKAKAAQSQAKGQSDYNHYYIFNFDDSTGYAVVSGDDQMPAIVGYSSRGSLDADSLPVQLKDFLQAYEATVDAVRNNDPTAVRNVKAAMARVAGSITPVEPLLGGIVWNQGAPFNNQCPIYDGENRAVTGCVATAMAQIMRYWKYPAQLMEDIGTYEVNYENNATGDTWTSTYGGVSKGITYDWGNMLESYNGDYNEAQANAVATLMSHCGLSVKMQYAGTSGAHIPDVSNALIKQFGYDEDLVQYLQRNLFEWDEWNEILQRELQAQRPVYYGGFASSGGHAFVCDGIDADGYYHINWGWGGISDDYFDITVLNPGARGAGASGSTDGYNSMNEIVIGITPDNSTKDEPLVTYDKLILTYASADFSKFKRENETENFTGTINGNIQNPTNEAYNALFTFALKNEDGSFTSIVKEPKQLSIDSQNTVYETFEVDYCFPVGLYKIYGVQSTDGGNTWNLCYGNQRNAVKIKVTEEYIMKPSDVPTDGIVIDGMKYKISSDKFTATLVANDYVGDVVIPESITYGEMTYPVTAINYWCFKNCALTSVQIPTSVTEIGEECFLGSTLSEIEIPNSVTKLGRHCFWNCENLKIVILSEGITELPEDCFQDCISMKSVKLPSRITELPDNCFNGCSTLEEINIPSSVIKLGKRCFAGCESLKILELPDGITELPDYCFVGCSTLEEINIPSSVIKLGERCFYGCEKLQNLEFPEGITELPYNCFYGCKCLKKVKLPEGITELPDYCFRDFSMLEEVIIPSSVTKLGKECFYGCENLKSLELPEGITELPDYCFGGCKSIKRVKLPEGIKELSEGCFHICGALEEINIPSSVTKMGTFCFTDCESIKRIKLPEGLTELPIWCFGDCTALEEINIPSSVTKIGRHCFYGCANLKILELSEGIEELSDHCFAGCSALEEINIPNSVTKIGAYCFNGCKNLKTLELPEGITDLPDYCLSGCSALENINIPNSVTKIGAHCFSGCKNLKTLDLPEGITDLPDYCLSGCSALENINIPNSVTKIGKGCFANCLSIKGIELPEGITELPDFCFRNCGMLEEACIPSSVTKIGAYCFSSCPALMYIKLPEGIEELSDYCFYGCSGLKEINIPSSVTKIGTWCFYRCDSINTFICRVETPLMVDDYFISKWTYDKTDGHGYLSFSYDCILYVPAKSLEAYKTAPVWKNFNTILPLETVGIENAASGHQSKVSYYHLNGLYITGEPKQAGIYIRETGGKRQKIVIR